MANPITDLRASTPSFTVYSSTARTATPDTQEFENLGRVSGLIAVIDATAISATPSIVFKVQGVDRLSGKTWDIITSAAVTGTGTTVLKISPGITTAANTAVADVVPPVIRFVATHGDADSITYTVTAHLIRS